MHNWIIYNEVHYRGLYLRIYIDSNRNPNSDKYLLLFTQKEKKRKEMMYYLNNPDISNVLDTLIGRNISKTSTKSVSLIHLYKTRT